jgi:hypothetical protein
MPPALMMPPCRHATLLIICQLLIVFSFFHFSSFSVVFLRHSLISTPLLSPLRDDITFSAFAMMPLFTLPPLFSFADYFFIMAPRAFDAMPPPLTPPFSIFRCFRFSYAAIFHAV